MPILMDSLGSTSSTSLTPLLQPWFHVELTPRAFANPYAKSSRYARESSVFAAAGLLPVSENLVDVDDMNFKFSDRFFEVPALRGVNVVQIAACAWSSFMRTDASRVLGWGANDYGYVDTLQHQLYMYSNRSREPEQRRQSGADTNDRESRRNPTPEPDPSRNTRNAPNEAPP